MQSYNPHFVVYIWYVLLPLPLISQMNGDWERLCGEAECLGMISALKVDLKYKALS